MLFRVFTAGGGLSTAETIGFSGFIVEQETRTNAVKAGKINFSKLLVFMCLKRITESPVCFKGQRYL